MYKKIINSSPVVRDAFEKVKGKIIKDGEEGYRKEMGTSPNRDLDAEIQKRTKLLLEI